MVAYTTPERCRVCGSKDLSLLFSLGEQYVNDFVPPGEETQGCKVPIELEICGRCSLVQAKHTSPQDFVYHRHYWYRSGVTRTMRDALRDVASRAEQITDLQSSDAVLDIGSNDGTLLRSYSVGPYTVGFEPALNLAEEGAVGVDCFINDFWDAGECLRRVPRAPRVVTAIGMLYDLEDPNRFIADVARVLAPDGVFVAQLMCLADMVALADVGNLAHEHLEFYSLRSLEFLLGRHGLEIFNLDHNTVNGRSTRLYCCHRGARSRDAKKIHGEMASELHLNNPAFYRKFFAKLEDNRRRCVDFIREASACGERIWVYGASTKGNVILQYYGLDKTVIEAAAERSSDKWGKVTVGTGIPITSEEEFRRESPDYALVLPYAFLPEFLERERSWLDQGGQFLVPLPEFRIVRGA